MLLRGAFDTLGPWSARYSIAWILIYQVQHHLSHMQHHLGPHLPSTASSGSSSTRYSIIYQVQHLKDSLLPDTASSGSSSRSYRINSQVQRHLNSQLPSAASPLKRRPSEKTFTRRQMQMSLRVAAPGNGVVKRTKAEMRASQGKRKNAFKHKTLVCLI